LVSRRRFLKLAAGGGLALANAGCRGLLASTQGSKSSKFEVAVAETVNHVIFTMQENRSFDHYFGKMASYRQERGIPGQVDGLPETTVNPSYDDTAVQVSAHHLTTECHEYLSPTWNEAHRQWNRSNPASAVGVLDGFVFSAADIARQGVSPPHFDFEGKRAMGYYDASDIPYYYALASRFAMSDRHFSSVMTSTVPNRMYLMAGSSFGRIHPGFPEARQVAADTIFDLCQKLGVTWRIYVNGNFTYYSWFQGYNRHKDDGHIVPAEQFISDAATGNLPQVAMIESGPETGLDEHPMHNIQEGARYMARFINALIKSPVWAASVLFLTYDEAGGFYDHVPPPRAIKPDNIEPIFKSGDVPGAFDRYGFRVPLIVVSPWVKPNFVSHSVTDHTSILRFIETRFALPSLTRRDAAAYPFTEMFDFSQPSLLNVPELPVQEMGGVCDWSQAA
jgi:phospholipase C